MKPTLVDVSTACQIIDIKRTKIYELMNDGVLRSVKIGRARRISIDSLEELIGQEVVPPEDGVWKVQKRHGNPVSDQNENEAALYSHRTGLICPSEGQEGPSEPAEASKRAIFFSKLSRDGEK